MSKPSLIDRVKYCQKAMGAMQSYAADDGNGLLACDESMMAFPGIIMDIEYLHSEIVRYRDALNRIAWPPHYLDEKRDAREIAIKALQI